MLPNLVAAVLITIVFALLARLVRRIATSGINKVASNLQVANLVGSVVYIVVLTAGLFVALGVLNLDKTVTTLLAGVGVIGLALGFAFQDIAANFMSGIFLAFRKPFEIGDIVETNGVTGTVNVLNLRATVLMTPTGQKVIVPNKHVFENPITNYTAYGRRRVDVGVGVSYGDDLEKAKRLALEAAAKVSSRDTDTEPTLFFTEFGGSSINFVVRIWVPFKKQPDYLSAQSEAIMLIKDAFDKNDITIPFPIRTLDFGIKGGETLAAMMKNGNGLSSS
ncbi:MAG: mechanosensitive ion channel family protein [Rhodothermales bacterium]|nr:mechanosensitive ion channel family protein [Rhodothermales bacterium]